MKKYDTYKDSGIEWIGEIPEHWEVSRYRYFYFSNMGMTILKEDVMENGIYPVYSATEKDIFFGFVDEATVILNEGDIVIPARGNSIGHIKIVTSPSTSTQTTIYSRRINQNIKTNYVKYFLQGLREHLFQFDKTAIPQITVNQIKDNPLIIPQLSEQDSIAEYLDQKTTEIDELIADKEELLKLYEEEKTVVINRAVTKGINPDAKMKDSGFEWLGEIPEHWETSSLKWVSKIYSGGTPSKNIEAFWQNGTIPWLNSGTVNQFFITEPSEFITEDALNNSSAKWISKGSILIALAGQGKTKGMVAQVMLNCTCNQSMGVIVPNEKIDNRFLLYYLKNNYQNIRNLGGGDKRDGINLEMVGGIYVPLIPFKEQQSIVKYIESETSRIGKKIDETQKLIDLLKEYREALISEVVTGKVKVV